LLASIIAPSWEGMLNLDENAGLFIGERAKLFFGSFYLEYNLGLGAGFIRSNKLVIAFEIDSLTDEIAFIFAFLII